MTRSTSTWRPAGARDVSVQVLRRIDVDSAWAAPTLDRELSRASLEPRDSALATRIVYGALRGLGRIDRELEANMTRPGRKLDPMVRAILRSAAYQLIYLDRVPAHAIVHHAVDLARAMRGPRVAGFVNAVLRNIKRPPVRPSTQLELPDWLRVQLRDDLGDRAESMLEPMSRPPPTDLRVTQGSRESLAEAIQKARTGTQIELGTTSPDALRVWNAGDPRSLPGFSEGRFAVQEQGSQLIGRLVGARPGEVVADACAGHGGKTAQLARAIGRGSVMALDLHDHRLRQIPEILKRLQISEDRVSYACVDLSVGTADLDGRFDRVLVDAPCSGLGTVQRRPEILWRTGPADIEEIALRQRAILTHAARLLRPGGTLVYAVCSPLKREAPAVETLPGLILDPWLPSELPPEISCDDDGFLRLGPWLGADSARTDAYQLFRARRLEAAV